MIHTISKGFINADADEVYSVLKNIKMWPEIFPPCQNTRIIKKTKAYEVVEITSFTKGKTSSWESQRVFKDENREISFKQLKTAKPLSIMQGIWIVLPKEVGTEVVLKHTFCIKPLILQFFLGRIIKKFFVDANSDNEIAGLKKYCERGNKHR